MSTTILALEEQRSRLERRADVVRSRLVRTIDALDTRRHQVAEIGHHARRLVVPVVATVLGAAVLAIGATMFALPALIERHREKKVRYRLARSLAPLRRERRERRRPFWQEALRRMTLAALGIIASELMKRGAKVMSRGRPLQLPVSASTPLLGR